MEITIIDLSREFLNSNGAEKHTDIEIESVNTAGLLDGFMETVDTSDRMDAVRKVITSLNICSETRTCREI